LNYLNGCQLFGQSYSFYLCPSIRLRSLFLILFFLSFAGHYLQADLIAHYDFSDGDLLDNKISA